MGKATELTSANFDSTINKGVTLVDFWAEWCGPCKMIAPIIEELAEEYKGKATVAKLNVDHEGEIAMRYNVTSIPTLLVIKDGEVKQTIIGATRKEKLAKALDAVAG